MVSSLGSGRQLALVTALAHEANGSPVLSQRTEAAKCKEGWGEQLPKKSKGR